jgi:hypothetical protein
MKIGRFQDVPLHLTQMVYLAAGTFSHPEKGRASLWVVDVKANPLD